MVFDLLVICARACACVRACVRACASVGMPANRVPTSVTRIALHVVEIFQSIQGETCGRILRVRALHKRRKGAHTRSVYVPSDTAISLVHNVDCVGFRVHLSHDSSMPFASPRHLNTVADGQPSPTSPSLCLPGAIDIQR